MLPILFLLGVALGTILGFITVNKLVKKFKHENS